MTLYLRTATFTKHLLSCLTIRKRAFYAVGDKCLTQHPKVCTNNNKKWFLLALFTPSTSFQKIIPQGNCNGIQRHCINSWLIKSIKICFNYRGNQQDWLIKLLFTNKSILRIDGLSTKSQSLDNLLTAMIYTEC